MMVGNHHGGGGGGGDAGDDDDDALMKTDGMEGVEEHRPEMEALADGINKVAMAMEDLRQDMESTVRGLKKSYGHIQACLLHYAAAYSAARHGGGGDDDDDDDDDGGGGGGGDGGHGHGRLHDQRKKLKMMKRADRAMVNELTRLSHLLNTAYSTNMSQLHKLLLGFGPNLYNPNPNPNPIPIPIPSSEVPRPFSPNHPNHTSGPDPRPNPESTNPNRPSTDPFTYIKRGIPGRSAPQSPGTPIRPISNPNANPSIDHGHGDPPAVSSRSRDLEDRYRGGIRHDADRARARSHGHVHGRDNRIRKHSSPHHRSNNVEDRSRSTETDRRLRQWDRDVVGKDDAKPTATVEHWNPDPDRARVFPAPDSSMPELLDHTVLCASGASKSFTKLMMSHMKKAGWDLEAASDVCIGSRVKYGHERHRKFAFESYVNHAMLDGFESEGFDLHESDDRMGVGDHVNKDGHQIEQKKRRTRERAEFREELRGLIPLMRIMMMETGHSSHLENAKLAMAKAMVGADGHQCQSEHDAVIFDPQSSFSRYCMQRFLHVVHPKMEESFFGQLEDHRRRILEHGAHPKTRFYRSFLKLALAIWTLHKLVFSVAEPDDQDEARKVNNTRIFGVDKGAWFSSHYMESIVQTAGGHCEELAAVAATGGGDADYGEDDHKGRSIGNKHGKCDDGSRRKLVAFTVMPGFRVGSVVIKCQVYVIDPLLPK